MLNTATALRWSLINCVPSVSFFSRGQWADWFCINFYQSDDYFVLKFGIFKRFDHDLEADSYLNPVNGKLANPINCCSLGAKVREKQDPAGAIALWLVF